MGENIVWNLVTPATYRAGDELRFTLTIKAPEWTVRWPRERTKKFYVMGGLYRDSTYIAGTLFAILQAAGTDYGTSSRDYVSVWELEPEQEVTLPCRLVLDRTNITLALFLFQMKEDVPNLGIDVEVDSISGSLAYEEFSLESLIASVIPVMMMMAILPIALRE